MRPFLRLWSHLDSTVLMPAQKNYKSFLFIATFLPAHSFYKYKGTQRIEINISRIKEVFL